LSQIILVLVKCEPTQNLTEKTCYGSYVNDVPVAAVMLLRRKETLHTAVAHVPEGSPEPAFVVLAAAEASVKWGLFHRAIPSKW